MPGRVEHLQRWNGFYQEQTSIGNDASQTWGALLPYKYAPFDYRVKKPKWARQDALDLSLVSVNQELDPGKTYRFWVEGADTDDDSQARIPDMIRPVYDKSRRFVHTVMEF